MREKTEPILQHVPMPIMTPRLRIEAVSTLYIQPQLEALRESRESLLPWMTWVHEPGALDESKRRKWLADGEAAFIRREKLFMLAFEHATGRLIGGTGFHGIDWDVPKFEIGYWVRTSAQRQGFAHEMSVSLLRYAFQALGANRVEIHVTDGNDKSQRVIEKTRIPYERMARNDHRLVTGDLGHTHIYAATELTHVPEMEVSWTHA